jgi:hypothetical protein
MRNKLLIFSILFFIIQLSFLFLAYFIIPGKVGYYLGAVRALLFDPITLFVSLINGFLFGYLKPSYKLFILTTITLISLVTLLIINPYRLKLNLSVDFFDFALFVRANVSLFWSASAIILINLLTKIFK